MALSTNQRIFVHDAEQCGLDIDYGYSGKHMYGQCCPAVYVDNYHELKTGSMVCVDNMGLGFVVYAMF